jgi:hypothetical protein
MEGVAAHRGPFGDPAKAPMTTLPPAAVFVALHTDLFQGQFAETDQFIAP